MSKNIHELKANDGDGFILWFEGGVWMGTIQKLLQALKARECLQNLINAHNNIDPASTAMYMEQAKELLRDPA